MSEEDEKPTCLRLRILLSNSALDSLSSYKKRNLDFQKTAEDLFE